MSENVYEEPAIIGKLQRDQNNEKIADIYLSAESLKVYDNPWMEGISPTTQRSTEAQHPVSVVIESSGKRNWLKVCSLFLGAACLLLLVGIIYLRAELDEARTSLDVEKRRNALSANFTKTTGQLKANITKLNTWLSMICKWKCKKYKKEFCFPDFDEDRDE